MLELVKKRLRPHWAWFLVTVVLAIAAAKPPRIIWHPDYVDYEFIRALNNAGILIESIAVFFDGILRFLGALVGLALGGAALTLTPNDKKAKICAAISLPLNFLLGGAFAGHFAQGVLPLNGKYTLSFQTEDGKPLANTRVNVRGLGYWRNQGTVVTKSNGEATFNFYMSCTGSDWALRGGSGPHDISVPGYSILDQEGKENLRFVHTFSVSNKTMRGDVSFPDVGGHLTSFRGIVRLRPSQALRGARTQGMGFIIMRPPGRGR